MKINQLQPKIYFSPFHNLTHRLFRDTFCQHFSGIDAFISPFMPVGEAVTLSTARFKDILPKSEKTPLIPQLIGCKSNELADSVHFLLQLGFERINWNLGCPMPQIIRKKRGAGLLPFPELIENAVNEILTRSPNARLSLKMRLGLQDATESLKIIERLNQYPLDFIAIHARLGVQRYEGSVDIEAFTNCFRISKNTVFYNGDINTVADFEQISTLFPTMKAVLLGRGLLKNPLLAEEIKQKNLQIGNKKVRIYNFFNDLATQYQQKSTPTGCLNRLKELIIYLSTSLEFSPQKLTNLLRINSLEEFKREIENCKI
ncbi:MAG: tRNA-dihydrouridine synthase family protein [Bacteroidales bacterium]|nr:tRNA-dihydrouridine synthase family protein [Bacteroidales bacterium]